MRRGSVLVVLIVLLGSVLGAPGQGVAAPRALPAYTFQDVLGMRARDALEWLHSQQQADGTFGGAVTTADAVAVIALVGEDPASPRWTTGKSALAALADQTADLVDSQDAGHIAKGVRAVAVAGRNPRAFAGYDLIAELNKVYDPTTGRYHSGNNFRQALAIEALALAGEPVPALAIATLLGDQHSDGGWGWPVGGAESDVDTTGLVLEALSLVGISRGEPHVQRAIAYLRAAQKSDGGWAMREGETYMENADSTALALRGLLAMGENPRRGPYTRRNPDGTWRDALGALLAFQEPSGAFRWTTQYPGTLYLSTFDAIPVLVRPWPENPVLVPRAYVPVAVK